MITAERQATKEEEIKFLSWLMFEIMADRMMITNAFADQKEAWLTAKAMERNDGT